MIDPSIYIEPSINVWTSIILFGIIQGIILLVYVYRRKGTGYQSLALLISTFVIAEIEAFLYHTGYMIHAIHWLYVSIPFVLLCGPALLSYVNQLANEEVGQTFWLRHGWPVALVTVYTFLFYVQPAQKKLYNYLTGFTDVSVLERPYQYFNPDPLEINGWIFIEGMALCLIIYGFISWRKSMRLSDQALRRWGLILAVIVLLIGTIMLLAEGGRIESMVIYEPILPSYMTRVHASIALYILAIYVLFNSSVLGIKPRYENSTLTQPLRKAMLQKIKKAYDDDKIHLDQDFNLRALASSTGIAEHHLSEVLNKDMTLTFYEITNSYRIEDAKVLLTQGQPGDWNMEQLAYHLGYKSKSTFYNAFKRETGLTPNQFRNIT